MKKTYVGVLGIIFIVLGVLGSLGIVFTFDWDQFMDMARMEQVYELELEILREQRFTTLVTAGATLLANLAIGVLLLALDNIINLLKVNRSE